MSHNGHFLPRTDAGLLSWSTNFSTKINASPETFGLTIAQAADYLALHDAYASIYQITQENDTRTPSAIVTKRNAKKALVADARKLARIVQAFPGTTDTMRSDLGLTVDADPAPIPPPSEAPEIDFMPTATRTIRIRLHNEKTLGHRGRPHGVKGATVFSYIGEEAPIDLNEWKFEGNTTHTVINIDPPPTVPSGTKMWFTAFWRNPRDQSGPATTPISTIVQWGGMSKAA